MSNRSRRLKPLPRPQGSNVIRMTTPAQMVAAMPLYLGYVPEESIVVMCCHEPRGRMGLLLRIDLPAPEDEDQWAKDIVLRVRHEDATRVVLMVYTEEPETGSLPRAAFMRRLTSAFSDIIVTEALLIRGGRFFSYVCNGPCCPADGTPVDDAVDSAAVRILEAETVASGRVRMPSREALEATLAPPPFLLAEVARQRCEVADVLLDDTLAETGIARTTTSALKAWDLAIARFASPPASLGDQEAATLARTLKLWQVRDLLAAREEGDTDALLQLLEELCRRTPAPYDAPVCTLFAWVSYCEGGGTLLTVALDRALTSDPGYSLATILSDALQRQMSPKDVRAITRKAAEGMRLAS
jgi:hypothetical protein